MLARKTLLILLNHVVGGVLGIALLAVIGHHMGPEPLGRFAYAWSVLAVVGALGDLGTSKAHTKCMSETGADPARALGTFLALRGALLVLVIAGFGGLLLLSHAVPGVFGWGADAPPLDLLAPLLLATLLLALRGVPAATFTALRQTARQEAIVLVEHVTRFAATLLAALAYAGHVPGVPRAESAAEGAVGLALAFALAAAASAAAAFVLLARSGLRPARPRREDLVSYTRWSLPFALAALVAIVGANLDRLLLGAFMAPEVVGLYHGSARLAGVLLTVPIAASALLFPRFSELLSAGARDDARTLLARATRRLAMLVLPAVALVVVFAEEGAGLVLGDAFRPAAPVLQLLAAQAAFGMLLPVLWAWVAGADRPGAAAGASIASTVAALCAGLVLIPERVFGLPAAGWGAAGAALATGAGTLAAVLLLAAHARRLGAGPLPVSAALRHVVVAAATAGALLAWKHSPLALPWTAAWALAVAAPAGFALHALMLRLAGEFRAGDAAFFRDLADSRALARYIAAELRRPVTR